jgi:hypothetical protein
VWSYSSATPFYCRFQTGTTLPLPCNSLLLLSVNHCGIVSMNVCSGVVTGTLMLSAGFDVLTSVAIKCCLLGRDAFSLLRAAPVFPE